MTIAMIGFLVGQLWLISQGKGWSVAAGTLGFDRPSWSRLSMQSNAYARRFYAVREDEGWRVIDPDRNSFDELGAILVERPDDVVDANCWILDRSMGTWAVTSRDRSVDLKLAPLGNYELIRRDRDTIRALIVPIMVEQSPWPDTAGMLRDAPWSASQPRYEQALAHTTDTRWNGVAHNVLAVAAFLILLRSLGWIPRTPAWTRLQLANRASARGRCPSCGYAIAGLDRCPECGRHIDRD